MVLWQVPGLADEGLVADMGAGGGDSVERVQEAASSGAGDVERAGDEAGDQVDRAADSVEGAADTVERSAENDSDSGSDDVREGSESSGEAGGEGASDSSRSTEDLVRTATESLQRTVERAADGDDAEANLGRAVERAIDSVGDAAGQTTDVVKETTHTATETTSNLAHAVGETLEAASQEGGDAVRVARDAAEALEQTTQRATETVVRVARSAGEAIEDTTRGAARAVGEVTENTAAAAERTSDGVTRGGLGRTTDRWLGEGLAGAVAGSVDGTVRDAADAAGNVIRGSTETGEAATETTRVIREAVTSGVRVVRETATAEAAVVRDAAAAKAEVVRNAGDAAARAVRDASDTRVVPDSTTGSPGPGRIRSADPERAADAGAPPARGAAATVASAGRRVTGGMRVASVPAARRASEPVQGPIGLLHARVAAESLPVTQPADDSVASEAPESGAAVERGWPAGWLPFTGICLLVLLAMAAGFLAGGGALGWMRRKVAIG